MPKETIVLFQGDSITDVGRDRNAAKGNSGLGGGYALFTAASLLADHPAKNFTCFNRGISGNRIVDFYARLAEDVINLKPDVLSILLGVNDTWHHFSRNAGVALAKFERVYTHALTEIKAALPDVRLVLCEPFVLPCGVVTGDWTADMIQRRAIVGRLAEQFSGILVPFQGMFDKACTRAPAEYWAADGVHPTAAGHMLMAREWLEKVKPILSER